MSRRCARCSGKTSEAPCKEIRRDLGHARDGLFATPRLPPGGCRPAAQLRKPTPRVVEAFDAIEGIGACFISGAIDLAGGPFGLQR